MPQYTQPENVNNSFFDGHYQQIWRQIFPEITTLRETDWIIKEGNLQTASEVLDIMCGHGRHCVELARRGMAVTAVDNLPKYINEIRDTAETERLPIQAICQDVLEMQLDKQYDSAICMGNCLQFFDDHALLTLLSTISSHLKTGAKFIVNTWSIAEIALRSFKEKGTQRFGNLLFQTENKLLSNPTRIEIKSIIMTDSGEREEKTGIDFIYSISELEAMLNKTGFNLKEVYSIPGKKPFEVGEPRAYIVSERL